MTAVSASAESGSREREKTIDFFCENRISSKSSKVAVVSENRLVAVSSVSLISVGASSGAAPSSQRSIETSSRAYMLLGTGPTAPSGTEAPQRSMEVTASGYLVSQDTVQKLPRRRRKKILPFRITKRKTVVSNKSIQKFKQKHPKFSIKFAMFEL